MILSLIGRDRNVHSRAFTNRLPNSEQARSAKAAVRSIPDVSSLAGTLQGELTNITLADCRDFTR
jgi:hypothetical protein